MLQWTSEIRVRVAWALRALSAHPHARFVSTLSPHRTANPPFDRVRLRTRPERSFFQLVPRLPQLGDLCARVIRCRVDRRFTSRRAGRGARFRPVESVPEKDRAGLRYVSFWGALVGPRKLSRNFRYTLARYVL